MLSHRFKRLFLEKLIKAHDDGLLDFYGGHAGLADRVAFDAFLKPVRKLNWYVNIKDPFAGPEAVLAYLSRYTHRVAISNRRLVRIDADGVAFQYKDYRADHRNRWKTMTLTPHEFIRRFLSHVLPKGFHRIRHYGLFANGNRAANIARARELMNLSAPTKDEADDVDGCKPRRGADPQLSLPLLRRTYDHHRSIRSRHGAQAPVNPGGHRQLMIMPPTRRYGMIDLTRCSRAACNNQSRAKLSEIANQPASTLFSRGHANPYRHQQARQRPIIASPPARLGPNSRHVPEANPHRAR